MSEKLPSIYDGILLGEVDTVCEGVDKALDDNIPADEILRDGMIPAMDEVGLLFEGGEYFIPDMLLAARAMKEGLAILEPLLVRSGVKSVGKVVLGTVSGDMHDIGKNLVGMMLQGAGFAVQDLGVDVDPEQFVTAVQKGVDVLGLSAMLTTTLPSMENVINTIEEAGLRSHARIMVGGAPVTAEYAQQIGADGYMPDASQAVTLAKSLIG